MGSPLSLAMTRCKQTATTSCVNTCLSMLNSTRRRPASRSRPSDLSRHCGVAGAPEIRVELLAVRARGAPFRMWQASSAACMAAGCRASSGTRGQPTRPWAAIHMQPGLDSGTRGDPQLDSDSDTNGPSGHDGWIRPAVVRTCSRPFACSDPAVRMSKRPGLTGQDVTT